MSYNHKKLLAEIPDETYAAKFLQKVGIIHSKCLCCGKKMYPDERKDRGMVIPGWRCSSCKARKGVRADIWLDPSKLPLDTIVEFIYWWSREYTSINFCEFELGMNHSAALHFMGLT